MTFLSVRVPARGAEHLLATYRGEFTDLLRELGPDRDLAHEPAVLLEDWSGWRLRRKLLGTPGIGPTIATKLMARKRPRLCPIWDTVVADVTNGRRRFWGPLHEALDADGAALHRQLQYLRAAAGLPTEVSPLRVFDVITWMQGKNH